MTELPNAELAAGDAELLHLGVALGQAHAFALIALKISKTEADRMIRL